MDPRAADNHELTDPAGYEADRRRIERREIDAHRAELVETVDALRARSWRRDVVFTATGALIGAILTAVVGLATR